MLLVGGEIIDNRKGNEIVTGIETQMPSPWRLMRSAGLPIVQELNAMMEEELTAHLGQMVGARAS